MKYVGSLILLAYAAMTLSGWEPFSRETRGTVPPGVRRGSGGVLGWHTGFMGGK